VFLLVLPSQNSQLFTQSTLEGLNLATLLQIKRTVSNDITAFSILDTASGTVSSYRFDTRYPDSEVVKFDEFSLLDKASNP
jgi:hypothetical protein